MMEGYDEPRIPDGQSLVYLPSGGVAHLSLPMSNDTVCRMVLRMEDRYGYQPALLGTGTQGEWEDARRLPLCKRCFPNGPRRPEDER